MINNLIANTRPTCGRVFFLRLLWAITVLLPITIYGHQTPSTVILMDVSPTKVAVELQIPLSELSLAFGSDVTTNSATLVKRLGPQIQEYLLAHIHTMVAKDKPWLVEVTDMKVEETTQSLNDPSFQEITVHLMMTPPEGATTRQFIFDYDVVMHQLVTHTALVTVRSDWETGKMLHQATELGIIRVDTKTTLIYPLIINLEKGSSWQGFISMVVMGKEHIQEGIDHLLFLLMLLLPIPLQVVNKKWVKNKSISKSLFAILKVVTAFTVGHSITLLIGAFGWQFLPTFWIEILIGFSILISAIHAIRPLFAGKEKYVAFGFGLIHGLAFANTLRDLHLDTPRMALSILGFNIGIELMQLTIILLTIPWLLLMSRTHFYTIFRIVGAIFATFAALAWIAERYAQKSNLITEWIAQMANNALGGVLILMTLSVVAWFGATRSTQ